MTEKFPLLFSKYPFIFLKNFINMGRGDFQFKQFRIAQDRCAMKVTTDATLFGTFPEFQHASKILDIGTGTGLLALMAAQQSQAVIHAIEIDDAAAEQAAENVKDSKWSDRISVTHTALQTYINTAQQKYDCIICNPPFYSNQTRSQNAKKRAAWHDELLPLGDLVSAVDNLLTPDGDFYIILPVESEEKMDRLCRGCLLTPTRKLYLKPFSKSPQNRVFIRYQRTKEVLRMDTLEIYQGHQIYTAAARSRLRNFLLNL